MRTLLRPLLFSLVAATFAGCASQPAKQPESAPQPASSTANDPKLDQRIQAEPPANTPEEIADRGAFDFVTAPGLTHEEKQKIMAIYVQTYKDAMAIREELGKAKSLMFKTVAAKNFASGDVEKLKAKIVKLDQRRLEIMFKALADVQAVIGYGKGKEEIYKHFRDYEIPKNRSVSKTK